MAQRRITVGTTPVLLAQSRSNRASISISMLPSSVETGNTGTISLGKGFVPSSTVGQPTSGDALTQGTQVTDVPQFEGDPSLFQGQWWGVADTAGQIIVVDETFTAAEGAV